ncbi:MAG: hypothetical protein P8J45_14890 [Phycisphaerales bacterium]|jgi:outer membrane murein-binding lipoprotein Lpp|nr:hypothetical protein [Phycisphaerales bacterium]
MKSLIITFLVLGTCLVFGCSEQQTESLKSDANQAGSATSDALKTAGDATRDDVHDAAQSIADDTNSD